MRFWIALTAFLGACGSCRESTPLIAAARNGDLERIETLLKAGADPNAHGGRNGWPPLMHAIHRNQPGAVRMLLAGGATLTTEALVMAAGYGYDRIVRDLLARGARPTPAALAAAVGGSSHIDRFTVGQCQTATVRALLEAAPGLRLRADFRGMTARLIARWCKCTEVLVLIDR